MKNVFVINTHSFVDLITNSNSELFVCNTTKSIDMVKDVLTKLIDMHDELSTNDYTHTFDQCFGEIIEAKYTFDLDTLPKDIVEEYLKYHRDYSWNDRNERTPSYWDAETKEKELQKTHPYYVKKYNTCDYHSPGKEERDVQWKDYLDKVNVIWTKYGSEKLEVTGKLFIEFLKYNSINRKEIAKLEKLLKKAKENYIKNNKGRYGDLHYLAHEKEFPKKYNDAYDSFTEYLSWDMTVRKGNILIYSASDNTIPYELFDAMDKYLSAHHYHLG